MAREFDSTSDLARATELSQLAADDPFSTPAFVESWRRLGWQPRFFFLREHGRSIGGCAGLLRSSPGTTTLEIPSLPEPLDPWVFWRGLLSWCAASGLGSLHVQSRGTVPNHVRDEAASVERRIEYRMALDAATAPAVWPSHDQRIQEANRLGVQIAIRGERDLISTHVRLARQTWEVHHGLETPGPHSVSRRVVRSLIGTGAGELHVAIHSGAVRATALVLLGAEGACLHSVGVDRAAASTGAAHLLLARLAEELQGRGIRRLILGDAEESHALVETLIAGFATERVPRESARFTFGPGWKRKLGTLARLTIERPGALLPSLTGRVERYVAYRTRPEAIAASPPGNAWQLEPLDVARLGELSMRFPDAIRHRDRARALGYCTAFGLFLDGELAHISWLVNATDDERNPIRNVKLRAGEAEIGPCSTFPAYRGRGLYPLVIRALCRIAADRGIEHVFMITGSANLPSQRGIEKAGLQRCGSIFRWVVPAIGGRSLTLRGHRWRPGLRTRGRAPASGAA